MSLPELPLPYGMIDFGELSRVAALARRLDRPQTTVRHWLVYGMSDPEMKRLVLAAIEEIKEENENDKSDTNLPRIRS